VVKLVWVPGHIGIEGNEIADQRARHGCLHPIMGPKHAFGISVKVARGVIRDWTSRKHGSIGNPFMNKGRLRGLKRSSVKKGRELLNLSPNH
jgi:hypothetical protein